MRSSMKRKGMQAGMNAREGGGRYMASEPKAIYTKVPIIGPDDILHSASPAACVSNLLNCSR